MKKIFLLSIVPIILAGCNNKAENNYDEKYQNLKVVVPTGAPAVAMAKFAELEGFETVTDPSKIVPMMVGGQADVAVLPTNVGVNAINKQALPFKLLCTITFGNFYVASTGKDEDDVMDATDYIVSFQQGAVPDKIFHYVHGNELDGAIHYVSSAQDAAKCLKTGVNLTDESHPVEYVVLAEPALTTVLKTTPTASLYEDLQSKYKEKSEGLILPQASVFVSNSLEQEFVQEKVFSSIKVSIEAMLGDPNNISSYLNKIENPEAVFGVKPEVAVEVTQKNNGMGIDCRKASSIKDDINNFLTIFGVDEIKDENIA